MQININDKSGFCFGVVNAINKAEEQLNKEGFLYCLGHIVHNNAEVGRLEKKGLVTISHEQLKDLKNCKVLIRAHGEPPETYKTAKENNIELIDASCKVVLKLQTRILNNYEQNKENGQVVIFGKEGHAEVNGLVGQTEGKAIVIKSISDLDIIDFSKPVNLYSQTTMDIADFYAVAQKIKERMFQVLGTDDIPLKVNDTICRQVANRAPQLKIFASQNDVVLFVSSKESSNGKVLYNICKGVNPNTHFICQTTDIEEGWFSEASSVGICGATSTPLWQMKEVATYLEHNFK